MARRLAERNHRSMHVRVVIAAVALALAILTGASTSVSAADNDHTSGCQGSWQRQFAVQVLVLDCSPGFATDHDRAYMFARDPVNVDADWRTQLSFENSVWVFDAGARSKASLIIDFHRDGKGLVAEFFDDTNGDGEVRYGLERGYPRSVETRFPVLKVIAPDGWWERGGRVNYDLRLVVDGPRLASWNGEVFMDAELLDGRPDVEIEVHASPSSGRPKWEIVQAKPPIPESSAYYRTSLMVNEADDEVPVTSYIFWRHLGYAGDPCPPRPPDAPVPLCRVTTGYGIVKDYNVSLPPIQIDFLKARLHAVGEFVASRGRATNWFVYSILRFGTPETIAANFENPFSFYDLAGANDGYPDLQIRDEYYVVTDPFVTPPLYGPFHILRYSWDQKHSHNWSYKLDLYGHRPMPSIVHVGNVALRSVPYAEYPSWVIDNAWESADFVAVEGDTYRSTEGIYETYLPYDSPYYFGLTTQKPQVSIDAMAPGIRVESAHHLGEPPQLYLGAIDRKLHLLNSEEGGWRINDTDVVRYRAIDGPYINHWEHSYGGARVQELFHLADRLILAEPSGLTIMPVPQTRSLFTIRPPTDKASWQALGQALNAGVTAGERFDLAAIADPFRANAVSLPGVRVWDVISTGKGYRFIAEVADDLPVTTETPATPRGTYVVEYAPGVGFSFRPAKAPEIALAKPAVQGDSPTELMPSRLMVRVRNDGDQAGLSVPVVFLANRPGEVARLAASTMVDVADRSEAVAEAWWIPPGPGDWDVSATVVGQIPASSEVSRTKVKAAPVADLSAILLVQQLRPFAGGAITASLTLLFAAAVGLGLIMWRAYPLPTGRTKRS